MHRLESGLVRLALAGHKPGSPVGQHHWGGRMPHINSGPSMKSRGAVGFVRLVGLTPTVPGCSVPASSRAFADPAHQLPLRCNLRALQTAI